MFRFILWMFGLRIVNRRNEEDRRAEWIEQAQCELEELCSERDMDRHRDEISRLERLCGQSVEKQKLQEANCRQKLKEMSTELNTLRQERAAEKKHQNDLVVRLNKQVKALESQESANAKMQQHSIRYGPPPMREVDPLEDWGVPTFKDILMGRKQGDE